MKSAELIVPERLPTYWKAKVALSDAPRPQLFWAYTQSLGLKDVRFQCEKKLRARQSIRLIVQAIHNGQRQQLQLQGQVSSVVLLSCGTLYGIEMTLSHTRHEDQEFIWRYLNERQNMKLSYSHYA